MPVLYEISCLLIIGFITLLFFFSNRRYSEANRSFGILLMLGALTLIGEAAFVSGRTHMDEFPSHLLSSLFGIYMWLVIAMMIASFKYIKSMINQDLPSLDRISPIGDWVVWIVMIPSLFMPGMIITVGENGQIISDYRAYLFMINLLIYQADIWIIVLRRRSVINVKRYQYLLLYLVFFFGVYLAQFVFRGELLFGMLATLEILILYLTLENPDVLLVEQLGVEKDRADEANRAKSDFIAHVSHEIRTPINAIQGMNEMILRESKEGAVISYSEDIRSAAQTLQSIVNDILDMSKMEIGKMEIIPVSYRLHSLLNDTVNMILLKAHDKKLNLIIEVDPMLPSELRGDDMRIRQVLTNLLTNAVKYTNEGSVKLIVDGERKDEHTERFHFQVQDTGIGLKEEDIQKLTVDFERFNLDLNRNVEGTGLGLSITSRFLQLMDSNLIVESVYGKGSTFSFYMDQEIINETPMGSFTKSTFSEKLTALGSGNYSEGSEFARKERAPLKADEKERKQQDILQKIPEADVLVVDDNAMNRKVFKALLSKTKLHIDEADGGASCLKLIEEKRYDVIFMDHMMPEMDGIETFHKIRETDHHRCVGVPIIMLTANAVMGARERYLEEGFDNFIAKPIIPAKLEELLLLYLS